MTLLGKAVVVVASGRRGVAKSQVPPSVSSKRRLLRIVFTDGNYEYHSPDELRPAENERGESKP